MKLLDYIKSNRKGKDANRLERQAMDDPFLADALEGLDSVEGDHAKQIEALQRRLTKKLQPKTYHFRTWSIAASILICISIGGYFVVQQIQKSDLFAIKKQTKESNSLEEQEIAYNDGLDTLSIYIPEKEVRRIRIEAREELPMLAEQMEKMPISISTLPVVSTEFAKSQESIEQYDSKNKSSQVVICDAMNEDTRTLDEVVVTGHGTQRKSNLTGSVSEVKTSSKVPNIKPSPLMGMKAYQRHLQESMKRPTDAVCGDKKGTVVLEFNVDAKGTPININVKKSLCVSMDIEAIRLLQQGPKWTVGSQTVELKVKF